MNYAAWFDALIVIAALGFVTWIYSVYKKDVSMVDSLWSLMFLAAAGVYFITADAVNDRSMFILALVAL